MSMIRINLAPVEDLENRLWWVLDAVVFTVVIGLGMASLSFYFESIEEEIAVHDLETTNLNKKVKELKHQLDTFASAEARIIDLEQTYEAISKITESKLARYLPIIILEHLQHLKPEGVWFEALKIGNLVQEKQRPDNTPPPPPPNATPKTEKPGPVPPASPLAGLPIEADEPLKKEFVIEGKAMSNVILAEFMAQLKATTTGDFDKADLRTQVVFDRVDITYASAAAEAINLSQAIPVMRYELKVDYGENKSVQASRARVAQRKEERKKL